ncbi:MAG: adenylate/guanylate cyclase domain-containing protein [Bacteroidota bacterium]
MKPIQYLSFIILLLGPLSLVGQLDSLYIDSLRNELEIGPDSSRLHTLMALADHYKAAKRRDTTSRKMGISYARRAKEIAFAGDDQAIKKEAIRLLTFYYRRQDMRDSVSYLRGLLNEYDYLSGFELPDKKSFRNQYNPISLEDHLQYWYDSTGSLTIEEAIAINQFSSRKPRTEDIEALDGAWWVRTTMISNAPLWEEYTFYMGGTQSRWDSVSIFNLDPDSSWHEEVTGNALAEDQWLIKEASNHFILNLAPNSKSPFYFRVRGTSSGIAPSRIDLNVINYHAYLQEEVKDRHVNGIFQGVVLIQLFFFLLLFLATKDKIYGYYALYIMGLGLFILTVNYASLWFGLDRGASMILYLVSITFCVVGMLTFSYNYLNIAEHLPGWRKFMKVYLPLFIGISLLTASSAGYLFQNFKPTDLPILLLFLTGMSTIVYACLAIGAMIFLPIWGFRVYSKGYSPAKYYLLATGFLFLGVIVPIILSFFTDELSEAGYKLGDLNPTILEAGIALQLCLFALAVGHKRNLLEKERRAALENNLEIQQKINAATDRFVPYEFLRSLGRESILDVNLGDQVEKRVTLFFSDIRDYTTLSEQMTPKQNFIFLNQYLGRVGPVIKTNRGFVNQYYGDGLLALFLPNGQEGVLSEQDAVRAALDMHHQVQEYNEERIIKERDPIRIGIGIHTGSLMLGVIGDEKRMDVGVVSDTVNTTARLEGLTKRYGVTTIVSGQTFQGLSDLDEFRYRPLGEVMVKGRKTPIALYDFFDGDPSQRFDLKSASLQYFMDGYEAYFQKRFKDAAGLFREVLKVFPNDLASQYFLQHAEHYAQNGVTEDWTGVEVLTTK